MPSISPANESEPKEEECFGSKHDPTKTNSILCEKPSSHEPKPMKADGQADFPHVEIVRTLEAQCRAWNEGHIQRYMEFYAEDAIYISYSLKKTLKSLGTEADICLLGRQPIEVVFRDVMLRSQKRGGRLVYQQIQIQNATTERACVMGRYIFSSTDAKEPMDKGVFSLDMARENCYSEGVSSISWKIKLEHSTSSA